MAAKRTKGWIAPIAQVKDAGWDIIKNHSTPEKTRTYTPVSHGLILDIVEKEAKKCGLQMINTDFRTAFGNDKVIGMHQFIDPKDKDQGDEPDRLIRTFGWRNSTDKSMSFGCGGGAHVFICSNGMFSADMVFVKKHLSNLDELVEEKIAWVFAGMEKEFKRLRRFRQHLKAKEISKRVQSELLGRLIFEEQLLSSSQIAIVKDQREFSEYFAGDTAWDLFNNITEALKRTKPVFYYNHHQKASRFFEKEFRKSRYRRRKLATA